ncbi:pilus assembly protein PilL, partial [Pseudomonas soli]
VKVDEVNRQVCFVLRPGYQLPTPTGPTGQLYADKTRAPATSSATPATTPGVVVAAVPAPAPITPTTPAVAVSAPVAPVLPPVAPAKDGSIPAATLTAAAKPSTPEVPAPKAPNQLAVAAPVIEVKPAPPSRPLPQVWTAEVGSTLRDSVEEWAKKARWRVIWAQEDLNYPIEAPLHFEGSFQEAIKQLFPLYDNAPRSFVVDGSEGSQSVLYVAERKKK